MLCKILGSEVLGVRSVWHGYQTGICRVFWVCAFFQYPGYFTIALPVLQPPCQKTHAGRVGNLFISFTRTDQCNTDLIITLGTTLTVPLPVL